MIRREFRLAIVTTRRGNSILHVESRLWIFWVIPLWWARVWIPVGGGWSGHLVHRSWCLGTPHDNAFYDEARKVVRQLAIEDRQYRTTKPRHEVVKE